MHTILLAVLGLAALLPAFQQPVAWKEFVSVEGKFAVEMPGDPTSNTIATPTQEGTLFTYTTSSPASAVEQYSVSWTEYPKESIESRGTEKTFNRMRDALVKFKEGKVLEETALTTKPFPNRTVTFSTSDGKVYRVQFYFSGNRIYQVMAETKKSNPEDLDRFFTSFKILPGTPL
jgi:hypothetical protein